MHMMLDLETAGNGADTVVLSAGMVLFDPFSELIGKTKYWVLPFDEQLKLGRVITPSTLVWWMSQSAEAQEAFKASVEYKNDPAINPTLYESVLEIVNYARGAKAVWGNGAAFDNTIMRSLSYGLKTKDEWPWNKDACYRTIANLARAKAGTDWYPKNNRGVHHNALDDAIWQAKALQGAFKVLGITSY